MRRLLIVLVTLQFTIAAVFLLFCHVMSNQLLYWSKFDIQPAKRSHEAVCTPWIADMAFIQLDTSCTQALQLPFDDTYVTTSEGRKVRVRVAQESLPADTTLFLHVHGISGNWLHGTRYKTLTNRMNMRLALLEMSNHGMSDNDGNGASFGYHEQHDVIAAIQFLKVSYPNAKVLLHGTSMGAMAIMMASQELSNQPQILGVALENPIPSVRNVTEESQTQVPKFILDLALQYAFLRRGIDFDQFKPIDQVQYLKHKTLVYQAQTDDLVPLWFSKSIAEKIGPNATLKVYPKGAHSVVWNFQQQQIENDFANLISP